MRKLDKYSLILSFILISGVIYYVFWGQNNSELTEDQMIAKMFKCPEYYLTEEEKEQDRSQWSSFYRDKYPNANLEEMMDIRYEFLVNNNCTETLQIWDENERETEEYWEEVYRQETIRSVVGTTTNNVSR